MWTYVVALVGLQLAVAKLCASLVLGIAPFRYPPVSHPAGHKRSCQHTPPCSRNGIRIDGEVLSLGDSGAEGRQSDEKNVLAHFAVFLSDRRELFALRMEVRNGVW